MAKPGQSPGCWNVAVAIVDTGGNLVYYHKMDNTQIGSAKVAIRKATHSGALQAASGSVSRHSGRVGEMGCGS
jgi:uncharacterized protein GlcG (DUF336 family)